MKCHGVINVKILNTLFMGLARRCLLSKLIFFVDANFTVFTKLMNRNSFNETMIKIMIKVLWEITTRAQGSMFKAYEIKLIVYMSRKTCILIIK